MVIFPALYFLLVFIHFYRKDKNITIVAYMLLLYFLTSLCSVIVVYKGELGNNGVLFTSENIHLGIIPTILYCMLLSFTIIPFRYVKPKVTDCIPVVSKKKFNIIFVFFVILSLLNLYSILGTGALSADFLSVRDAHYSGEISEADAKLLALPFPLNYLVYFSRLTILALPFLFYSLCFMKNGNLYNLVLFFCTLTLPISSLKSADRAQVLFYILMLGFTFVLFKPFINNEAKLFLRRVFVPLLLVICLYLVAVTVARFAFETNDGAFKSVLYYAGQSYLNFCYFFENANHSILFWDRMFPLVSHFFNGLDYESTRIERALLNGFPVGVFPTFLGSFLLDLGLFVTAIWSIFFNRICSVCFKYQFNKRFRLGSIVIMTAFAIIPIFGIFYYYYYYYISSLMLVSSLLLGIYLNYKNN